MLNKTVVNALNKQINAELLSGYMYLSAGSFMDDNNYSGMASWLFKHAHEEYEHAMRIRNFLANKGEQAKFYELTNPDAGWKNVEDVWKKIYEHEVKVTEMILDLVDLARKNNDTTSEVFLHWFVNEQVEEENITSDILERVMMIGKDTSGMLKYDIFIGKQVAKGNEDTAKFTTE